MKEFPIYTRRVQFADTDLAGVVHFSKILCYVEEAEHFVMREVGVPAVDASGGFPKVHVDCDYRSPMRFGDEVEIKMQLEKVGEKSLVWGFTALVAGSVSAKGSLVTVYVSKLGESAQITSAHRAHLA
ncbi:MAG: thioesterase family protein [Rubritalea sp.]|uniref:acyl-CoA thioesterase n=1 Tax=Rubritalea sp. TaxID=2109375 RepID=UPI003242105D